MKKQSTVINLCERYPEKFKAHKKIEEMQYIYDLYLQLNKKTKLKILYLIKDIDDLTEDELKLTIIQRTREMLSLYTNNIEPIINIM